MDSISSPTSAYSVLPGQRYASGSRPTAERHVQDVFSAVLQQAEREGYASAQSLPESTNVVEAVASSWEQWFNEFSSIRYTFIAGSESPSVRENKTAMIFEQTTNRFWSAPYQNGGYASPESYLKKLSSEDLATIQQVHHLADPIQPDTLSSESALNLLLPPDAQVDENRDGLTAVGAAYTIRFPDSNTPPKVRMAWEASTKDMSEQDRMLHVMQMSSQLLTANMHFDQDGQYVRSSELAMRLDQSAVPSRLLILETGERMVAVPGPFQGPNASRTVSTRHWFLVGL